MANDSKIRDILEGEGYEVAGSYTGEEPVLSATPNEAGKPCDWHARRIAAVLRARGVKLHKTSGARVIGRYNPTGDLVEVAVIGINDSDLK